LRARHGKENQIEVRRAVQNQRSEAGREALLVVADDSGLPVMQQPYYLAWHKATGVYYVGGTDPRIYLKTRHRLQAAFRFRE